MSSKKMILSLETEDRKVSIEVDEDEYAALPEFLGLIPNLCCAWGWMPGSFPNSMHNLEEWVDCHREKEEN